MALPVIGYSSFIWARKWPSKWSVEATASAPMPIATMLILMGRSTADNGHIRPYVPIHDDTSYYFPTVPFY